jgi:glycosyltransferase involved in cell wall biosynthesis
VDSDLRVKERRLLVVTSIHADYDARIWRHCTSMVRIGYTVTLIAPWQESPEQQRSGVELVGFRRVQRRVSRVLLVPLRVLPLVLRHLRNADIVHFHDIDLLPWMAFVSFLRPVVYDVHENYPEEMLTREWIPAPARGFLYWVVRGVQWCFASLIKNIVICVPTQRKHLKGRRFRCCVLRNYATQGLVEKDSTMISDKATTKVRVVFSGGHYDNNGSLLLLEIARELNRSGCSVEFLVVDRFACSNFRNLFFKKREQYGLEQALKIEKPVPAPRIMEFLNKGDIALACNLRVPKQELAIPTKLFEYMAAGLPIVSSDLPYPRELFDSCRCGVLARPESVGSFVDAIKMLVSDQDLREQLGAEGRKSFLSCYTWESQLPSLLEFYEEIITSA